MLRPLGAIAAIALLLTIGMPGTAEAKPCGSVVLRPGVGWIVGGAGLSCRKMRRWSRSMLLGGRGPKGWHCTKHGHGRLRSGGCSKGPNGTAPFFIYYPPD